MASFVVSHDVIELNNLHGQIIHGETYIGQSKVESAAAACHSRFSTSSLALGLIPQSDLRRLSLAEQTLEKAAENHGQVVVSSVYESNTNLIMATLTCISGLASAMGPAIEKSSKIR
ncbi:hypothetical protein L1987_59118 [Smallanthus sonchifolius]|uniref:Uncharacterized protein n=1 Tax=Smallanthus sonchifolius TaxID=185202 RepID=A0ACB9D4L4_9ASTR|nr:hypothetical protein L1987_59118 [Smallanthus sonchifolius]